MKKRLGMVHVKKNCCPVWPDWAIFCTLANFLRPLATINLPKSPIFFGNFCKVVKIYHICSGIIFGQLLWIFGNFFLVTCCCHATCSGIKEESILFAAAGTSLRITISLAWHNNNPRRSIMIRTVWPDWAIYWTLCNFLKPLATINLSKYLTFLGNFCKGVKVIHFSCEIIFGQLL